jgi:GDP-4-dehydro-6-deoxy-D-mannose reductase
LITGCGGFAGSHLVEHLTALGGWELWGTVFRPGEAEVAALGPVRVTTADLRDPAEARRVLEMARPEVLFHLAGQAYVPEAAEDPWATFETNVRAQLNVLQALWQVGEAGRRVRVVAVTSQELYGPGAPLPTDEAAPLAPASAYGASKAAQDLVAAQFARGMGLDVVRARPYNHIGPRQDSRFVVASFARQVAEIEAGLRPPVVEVGDLSAERDFTDVRDIVRAYRLLAERGRAGEAYNLGSGTARPIREVLYGLLSRVAFDIEVRVDPARLRQSDTPRTQCDPAKAAAELGWRAEIPFEQSLADTLDHWRAQLRAGQGQPAELVGS